MELGALIAGSMAVSTAAGGAGDSGPPIFGGLLQDEVLELRAEVVLPPSEQETKEVVEDPPPRSSDQDGEEDNAWDRSLGDSGEGAPTENLISLYCSIGAELVDPMCQSIANAVDCTVVAPNQGPSRAPVCLDETPAPVVEETVVEAAVDVPADEGPTIEELLEQIPGLVAEEFATLPIDGGSVAFEEELLGFGYINRHTNVFAEVEQQTFEQNMLGIDVELRAVPVDYHFDYGDGTTRTTADPGQAASGSDAALTDLETPTSHVYQETGLYAVEVTTTFTGEYRIAGGSWTPIADSTTVAASPGEADIWRTQSRHVSGTCEDPRQWGCNGPFTLEGDDRPPKIFADQYDDAGNWRGP